MGGVWNGFLLGKARKEDVPCRFCGKRDGDGHLFWECTFSSLQHVRDLPGFATLRSLNRSNWPHCLLWHGWLPGLNGIGDNDPCATSFGDLASVKLERCVSAYHAARNKFERYRGFLELISRFEFEFRRREIKFLNDSNFWCVQSSITHHVAVHVRP